MWRGEGDMSTPAGGAARAELRAATEKIAAWNDRLEAMDTTDRAAWKREAAYAGGTVSLVASRVDPQRAQQLGAVADRLARSGRSGQGPALFGLSDGELVARHLNLALRAGGLNSGRGWAAVMQQMSRTIRAIQQAHEARGELAAAQRLLASAPVLEHLATTVASSPADTNNETQRHSALHGRPSATPGHGRRAGGETGVLDRPAKHDSGLTQGEEYGR